MNFNFLQPNERKQFEEIKAIHDKGIEIFLEKK